MNADIRRLDHIEIIRPLSALAEQEGFRMLHVLIDDWENGVNRFDLPGELILGAFSQSEVVGICGLNRDPFTSEERVGRIRRLYVHPSWRRKGVASSLVRRLMSVGAPSFDSFHVRTHDEQARAFYGSLGFIDVKDDPNYNLRRSANW